jgi:hypothetical protein
VTGLYFTISAIVTTKDWKDYNKIILKCLGLDMVLTAASVTVNHIIHSHMVVLNIQPQIFIYLADLCVIGFSTYLIGR